MLTANTSRGIVADATVSSDATLVLVIAASAYIKQLNRLVEGTGILVDDVGAADADVPVARGYQYWASCTPAHRLIAPSTA